MKIQSLKNNISLIILLMITVPVIVHTRSLLLEITRVDGPRWVLEVYAIFFAVAFDCSIFMFALYKKREQAIAFAVISGIVGWLFWCSDLVFVDMQQQPVSGQHWSRLLMGTVWAVFSAYLVFWCSEIVAESFGELKVEGSGLSVQSSKSKVQEKRQHSNTLTPRTIPPRTITPNKKAQALQLQDDGLSIPEIAEQLGVSIRTVRRYQSNGVG